MNNSTRDPTTNIELSVIGMKKLGHLSGIYCDERRHQLAVISVCFFEDESKKEENPGPR